MFNSITKIVAAASVATLAACGGGGGGNTSTQAETTYAMNSAFTRVLTAGINTTATAVDDGDTYTINQSITPSADTTFESAAVKSANQVLTIKVNGEVLSASSSVSYFTVSPYALKGVRFENGEYAVQTVAATPLTDTATVGSSGSLGKVTLYSNSQKSSIVATIEGTWTLEPDTATTAYACQNSILKNGSGVIMATTALCYKISADGSVRGLRYTLAADGSTLVFR